MGVVKDALVRNMQFMQQMAQQQLAQQQAQVNFQNDMAARGFSAQQAQVAWQNKQVQDAIGRQMGILRPGLDQANKMLTGKVGFDPAMLAHLNAQTVDQTGSQFNEALSSTKLALARRGENGSMPSSGGFGRGFGSLEAARASTLSQGLRGNSLANLQAALANRELGMNFIGGTASMMNPAGFFGAGSTGAFNQAIAGGGANPGIYGSNIGAAFNSIDNSLAARTKIGMEDAANSWGNMLKKGLSAGISGGISGLISGGTSAFMNRAPAMQSPQGLPVNSSLSTFLANPGLYPQVGWSG